MGSVAKIPELAFLAFHNRSFMPFSAHHFCQETIFATEPLFPSFVELAHESFDGKHIPVARRGIATLAVTSRKVTDEVNDNIHPRYPLVFTEWGSVPRPGRTLFAHQSTRVARNFPGTAGSHDRRRVGG